MRVLIFSDVHSNWEALAAMAEASAGSWDQSVCLGDVVGYGANPNEVVAWTRAHTAALVRGNHDRACAQGHGLEHFQATAAAAVRWTSGELTPESRTWLTGLPAGPREWRGMGLSHGSPLDEDEYVLGPLQARRIFEASQWHLQWCGHTHVQGGFRFVSGSVAGIRPGAVNATRVELQPGARYLLNPGSVGQPRDGSARAAFAIWDEAAATVEFFRVPYDIAATQNKILRAGLPPMLARRLGIGR